VGDVAQLLGGELEAVPGQHRGHLGALEQRRPGRGQHAGVPGVGRPALHPSEQHAGFLEELADGAEVEAGGEDRPLVAVETEAAAAAARSSPGARARAGAAESASSSTPPGKTQASAAKLLARGRRSMYTSTPPPARSRSRITEDDSRGVTVIGSAGDHRQRPAQRRADRPAGVPGGQPDPHRPRPQRHQPGAQADHLLAAELAAAGLAAGDPPGVEPLEAHLGHLDHAGGLEADQQAGVLDDPPAGVVEGERLLDVVPHGEALGNLPGDLGPGFAAGGEQRQDGAEEAAEDDGREDRPQPEVSGDPAQQRDGASAGAGDRGGAAGGQIDTGGR
jgi:hypothetical protein